MMMVNVRSTWKKPASEYR